MLTGTVKWYDHEKGFGFITRDDGEGDVFVHRSATTTGFLYEGDQVEFDIVESEKGPRAEDVKVLESSSLLR